MNISPVNFYGNQTRLYMPKFQAASSYPNKNQRQVADDKSYMQSQKYEMPLSDVPLKDTNLPKSSKLSFIETSRNIDLAGKVVKNSRTGLTYVYNKSGYVNSVLDSNGDTVRAISRKIDGKIIEYIDHVFAGGNAVRTVYYNADGSVKNYFDRTLDANGKRIRTVCRNSDGSVKDYTDYVLDSKGNTLKAITHNADGSLFCCYDHVRDANGSLVRIITRYPDGTIK